MTTVKKRPKGRPSSLLGVDRKEEPVSIGRLLKALTLVFLSLHCVLTPPLSRSHSSHLEFSSIAHTPHHIPRLLPLCRQQRPIDCISPRSKPFPNHLQSTEGPSLGARPNGLSRRNRREHAQCSLVPRLVPRASRLLESRSSARSAVHGVPLGIGEGEHGVVARGLHVQTVVLRGA